MKLLIVLGWIFVPYIMIVVRWKKIGVVAKSFGCIWTFFALLMVIPSFIPDDPLTAEEMAALEAETKALVAETAAIKAETAVLEAKAKEPISMDYATFDDPYDNMTDVQKDKFWEGVKGKYVQWTGKVVEVTDKSIQVKVDADTLVSDFLATIVKDQRGNLVSINIDDTITIYGKLSSKEGIFLPWSLDDAEIK